MKVVILMENSTCRDTVACAHGLSMYIETDKHKILFDMGPDAQFIDNAKALGVDLTQVDIAFLSHEMCIRDRDSLSRRYSTSSPLS